MYSGVDSRRVYHTIPGQGISAHIMSYHTRISQIISDNKIVEYNGVYLGIIYQDSAEWSGAGRNAAR